MIQKKEGLKIVIYVRQMMKEINLFVKNVRIIIFY